MTTSAQRNVETADHAECIPHDRFWWSTVRFVRKPGNAKQSMCDLLLRLLVHKAETNDAIDPLTSRAHVEEGRDHDITMRVVSPILVRNLIGRELSWEAQLRGDADVDPREYADRGDAADTDTVNTFAGHGRILGPNIRTGSCGPRNGPTSTQERLARGSGSDHQAEGNRPLSYESAVELGSCCVHDSQCGYCRDGHARAVPQDWQKAVHHHACECDGVC